MYTSSTKIRVRYGETDKMGFLYYGYYALYYEQGRTDAIRQLGITYKSLEEKGIIMPVVEMKAKYYRPAHYDDIVTVQTSIPAPDDPNNQIRFECQIFNDQGKKLNESVVTLVFYDNNEKKKVPMPDMLKKKLLPYY